MVGLDSLLLLFVYLDDDYDLCDVVRFGIIYMMCCGSMGFEIIYVVLTALLKFDYYIFFCCSCVFAEGPSNSPRQIFFLKKS